MADDAWQDFLQPVPRIVCGDCHCDDLEFAESHGTAAGIKLRCASCRHVWYATVTKSRASLGAAVAGGQDAAPAGDAALREAIAAIGRDMADMSALNARYGRTIDDLLQQVEKAERRVAVLEGKLQTIASLAARQERRVSPASGMTNTSRIGASHAG